MVRYGGGRALLSTVLSIAEALNDLSKSGEAETASECSTQVDAADTPRLAPPGIHDPVTLQRSTEDQSHAQCHGNGSGRTPSADADEADVDSVAPSGDADMTCGQHGRVASDMAALFPGLVDSPSSSTDAHKFSVDRRSPSGEGGKDSGHASKLQRAAFNSWKAYCRNASERRSKDLAEAQLTNKRVKALSLWLLVPGAHGAMLKASFCAWRDVIAATQELRREARSRQRATFSPEEVARIPPSPVPVRKALGAFFANTQKTHVQGSFFAWKDCVRTTKRHTASLMWLMERMAFSSDGLILQATFRSWLRLTEHNRQPAWATALQQDLQNLRARTAIRPPSMDASVSEDFTAKSEIRREQSTWLRQACCIPVLVCAFTLILHVLLLAFRGQVMGMQGAQEGLLPRGSSLTDSDGDGVRDVADRCPNTPAHHKFTSTWRTDWDSDGCLDGLEDLDDDDDMVPNSQDVCPRSASAIEDIDVDGCSPDQREERMTSTWLDGAKLRDIVLEVLIGGLITATINSQRLRDCLAFRWQYLKSFIKA